MFALLANNMQHLYLNSIGLFRLLLGGGGRLCTSNLEHVTFSTKIKYKVSVTKLEVMEASVCPIFTDSSL